MKHKHSIIEFENVTANTYCLSTRNALNDVSECNIPVAYSESIFTCTPFHLLGGKYKYDTFHRHPHTHSHTYSSKTIRAYSLCNTS